MKLTHFICLLFFSTLSITSRGDVVDDFTVVQGPLIVGPGQTLDEDLLVIDAPGVLGGFRTAVPSVNEDAAAGSNVGLVIVNGFFECNIDYPNTDPVNNNGGCAIGWDRSDGPTFDLSNAGSFEFDVLSVDGGLVVAVGMVDTNEAFVFFPIENPVAGPYVLPLDQFVPLSGGPVDLSLIDNISLTVINQEGLEGNIQIGALETSGPIGGGPVIPVTPAPTKDTVSGTYFNAARSGEGCQVTLEGDEETFILTCYLFQNGEQAWLIGTGRFAGDEIDFANLTITSGTGYGNNFNADEVERVTWGSAGMVWSDCNNAELILVPQIAGFTPFTVDVTKVTPSNCNGQAPSPEDLLIQGTFLDPNRSGEGFQIALQGDSGRYVITWYTYLQGEQVWLIGTGTRSADRIDFNDVVITRGADFGADFNPADVVRTPWGTISLEFSDCNNATASANPLPSQSGFTDLQLNVSKVVAGNCEVP